MSGYKNDMKMAQEIAVAVKALGGRTFYVGGFVRDRLMGADNKDIDIEVHGIAPYELENVLDRLGERITIGQSFGIYGLKGYGIDIAMPRKEKLRGSGHRDFDVFVDPFAGVENAVKRRDFTINSLMQDVLTEEIIDSFGGGEDLKNKIIRHISDESFAEDPLRVVRAAQFAARFEFTVADETVSLCSKMNLSALSKERIEAELKKALLKSEKPSIFFEILRKMNQLDYWFPELKALIGIEQNATYHAEGDVWNHTMMVLDCAVQYRDRVQNPLGFMLGALVHDFGKAVTSESINGVIHAYNHEQAGLPISEKFLKRITGETKLIDYALNLALLHMKPNVAAGANSSIKSTNKMFDSAINPLALVYIALADGKGRINLKGEPDNEPFLMNRLEIYKEYMSRPFVGGRDLIEAGFAPNESFSEILAYAHKLRLAGVDKESALKQVLVYGRQVMKGDKK